MIFDMATLDGPWFDFLNKSEETDLFAEIESKLNDLKLPADVTPVIRLLIGCTDRPRYG